MLLTLLLYGSRARGDNRLRADVDLLGVVEGGSIGKEVSARGTSFYHYPLPSLIKNARAGDLFVCHLVNEAKVIHDTANVFAQVCEAFTWKANYRSERRQAKLIIRYLCDRPETLSAPAARKRLAWALRTLVISKAADEKIAVFGSTDLANYVDEPSLKSIIDARSTVEISDLIKTSLEMLRSVGNDVRVIWPAEKNAQTQFMLKAGGILASTARMTLPRLPIGDSSEISARDYPM